MKKIYDVAIVGARCAGAATAMLLARQGLKVLLVDRSRFPSDIAHGHYVHKDGPRLLKQWGLLDRIVATGCPPVTSHMIDLGPLAVTGCDLIHDGVAAGYAPRRTVLDGLLVEAAIAAGVEFRDCFNVDGFVAENDGRIAGLRGYARSGTPVTERAFLTVGADGRTSGLAKTVSAPAYDEVPTQNAWYYSYWSGVPVSGLEIYIRQSQAIIAHPTNDGLTLVAASWPLAELGTVQAAMATSFMLAVAKAPSLAERVRAGRREERFYGAANLPNFFRKPFGRGWALVGDAGCHKDPIMGLGCGDALRDAGFLANAIWQGMSGPIPLEMALAGYETKRNVATLPDYKLNISLASFEPRPEQERQLMAAIAGDQEEMNRFFRAREGMIPPASYFDAENIARIVGAAQERMGKPAMAS
jgi:2-polyprenyl-6-methoxyphenol hydroxylase-like FAD-dependent oxidoreductase